MNDIFDKNIVRENSIPICYATCDDNVLYTLTSMVSIAENTSELIDFVVLFPKLSKKSTKMLDYILNYSHCNLVCVEINPQMFTVVSDINDCNLAEWYRILVPHVLSKVNKAIYLSSKTLIRGDISELYNIDLGTNVVAGINDIWSVKYNVSRLNMKSDTYLNTDVLLINCEKWRKNNISDKIMGCAVNNVSIVFRISDALNCIIDDDKLLLYKKFNYIETWWHDYLVQYSGEELTDYNNCKTNPLIVNFVPFAPDDNKSKHSFKVEWHTYLEKIPSDVCEKK